MRDYRDLTADEIAQIEYEMSYTDIHWIFDQLNIKVPDNMSQLVLERLITERSIRLNNKPFDYRPAFIWNWNISN